MSTVIINKQQKSANRMTINAFHFIVSVGYYCLLWHYQPKND
ncbi:hypothetical protein VAA_02661 [Vibrio anguillarum 775]|nr:hypothetical protein VAA_02661 [Vibrio anguillarum 775]